MSREEQLTAMNSTIDMIKDSCGYALDISDAKYIASYVEQWLNQLLNEIDDYENMSEEEED